MLRIEFKNQPYDWFNLDDMGDVVRSDDFANTLRENIVHYFSVPYDCQVVFDEDGLLNAPVDFSRSLQRIAPYFRVYDAREMPGDLKDSAMQKLRQVSDAVARTEQILTNYCERPPATPTSASAVPALPSAPATPSAGATWNAGPQLGCGGGAAAPLNSGPPARQPLQSLGQQQVVYGVLERGYNGAGYGAGCVSQAPWPPSGALTPGGGVGSMNSAPFGGGTGCGSCGARTPPPPPVGTSTPPPGGAAPAFGSGYGCGSGGCGGACSSGPCGIPGRSDGRGFGACSGGGFGSDGMVAGGGGGGSSRLTVGGGFAPGGTGVGSGRCFASAGAGACCGGSCAEPCAVGSGLGAGGLAAPNSPRFNTSSAAYGAGGLGGLGGGGAGFGPASQMPSHGFPCHGAQRFTPGSQDGTFEVSLVKNSSGERFGFANVPSVDGRSLLVTWVDPNLLLGEWNRRKPDRMVREGDVILSVNDCGGDLEAMRAQLQLDAITMRVHSAGGVANGTSRLTRA